MLLDEVHPIPQDRVLIVRAEDHLETKKSSRGQQVGNLTEKGLRIAVTHRLKHFDGDNFVESSRKIAVVAEDHLDKVSDTRRLHPCGGLPELLLTNRRGGHTAAIVLSRVDGETTPPTSDLKHEIMR